MKNLITNTIISQAISLGFDFSNLPSNYDLYEVSQSLLDFFSENSDRLETIEDECEVTAGKQQSVIYGDYECFGEIVNFSDHWHKPSDTKIYHSDFVTVDTDGLVKRMKLYYLVGETDLNQA